MVTPENGTTVFIHILMKYENNLLFGLPSLSIPAVSIIEQASNFGFISGPDTMKVRVPQPKKKIEFICKHLY